MQVLVPVKQVIDYRVHVKLDAEQKSINKNNVKLSINPFDEIAIEEALRWREAGLIQKISAISIGSERCIEVLRHALAMGADDGILVNTDKQYSSLNYAKILQHFVQQKEYKIVILGKQAIDSDNNQTGQMLAGLLNWPQATFASKIELSNTSAKVWREIDTGLDIVQLKLPAIITTDLRLNKPRYCSLPNIVKAKTKPIEQVMLSDLNLSLPQQLKTLNLEYPETKHKQVKILKDSLELINILQQQEQII